ncbi:MAG: MarR family winged helix-turn-helix transcriptional regulator [Alphaproteobacteria bacterium]
MSSKPEQRRPRRRRVVISSYPVPTPEAVEQMRGVLFSGRFADDHLSALLARASLAISQEFHEDVRRHRMPIHQWRVLASLSDAEGMSLSEVAELTLIRQSTLTRLVQRLEAQGIVRKSADAADRRMIRLALTKRGREKVAELLVLATEQQKRMLQGVDAEGFKAALQYLIAFCAAKRRRRQPFSKRSAGVA